MKIELHKVHLSKKNEVSFEYKETDKESSAPVAKGPFTAAVHEDLILAMSGLDPHLAIMTEQLEVVGKLSKLDADEYENFHAKSYSFTGDRTRGIIISGNKVMESGKVFNFNTPNYLLEQSEETGYKYMPELLEIVERINKEALAFIDGTKRGNDPQGKIPFEDEKGKGSKTVVQALPPVDNGITGEWEPGAYPVAEKTKKSVKEEKVVPEGKVTGKGKVEPVKTLPGKKKGTARVAQSAAAPSGEIKHEGEDE